MSTYICEFCEKSYSTISNYKRHQRLCSKKIESFHDKQMQQTEDSYKQQIHQIEESYKQQIQQLQKVNEEQIHQIEKVQKTNNKLQKENRDYEIEVAELRAVNKSLEKAPRIINNNNYTHNNTHTTNNNIFLGDINDSLLKQIAGKIPQDVIADGSKSIGKYLLDNTDLFNYIYKSNPQLKTITYKTPNTKKLVKDNGGIKLAKMIVDHMPDFDVEKNKRYKRISKDTEDFYINSKTEDSEHIKKLGLTIYEKALTETELLDKQNNSKHTYKNFTTKLMEGIINYITIDINCKETCLYYGMTGILCSLYRQGLTNAVDDNDKPSDNFFEILHYLMSLCSLFFNRKFLDEIDSLEESDPYHEITKSSHDDFLCWLKDPTYKMNELQNTLDSYREIDDD